MIRETLLFTDEAAVIADMLRDEWSLGPSEVPNIEYIPEKAVQNARVGAIFVYVVSTSNRQSTTDYRTIDKTVHLNIKLDNRTRDNHFKMGQEIYRILMANRRIGRRHNMGNSYLEVNNHRTLPNEVGWYTTIFDVTFVAHNVSLISAGFGDKINSQIEDNRV